ncbi:hypothetical protein HK101_000488 [Irineochytrium annulatum]|nr:hypothetical protein HK101_000488 [Irineochytrium annulatum]
MGAFLSSPVDLDQLRGKSVVITGCDTGFGNMTTIELISHGLNVYAGCLTEQGRQGLINQCNGLQAKVPSKGVLTALILDVTKDDSVAAFKDAVEARVPEGIYALVNNAGIAGVGPFELMPQADHRLIFEVNYFGPLRMMHAFLPSLRRFAKTHPRSRPRLINVASLAGRTVTPNLSAYGASKHALRSLTDSVRVELRRHGVLASCIEPIFARTNIVTVDRSRQLLEQFSRCDEEVREAYGGDAVLINRIRDRNEGLLASKGGLLLTAEAVVANIVSAVESPKPRPKYLIGMAIEAGWLYDVAFRSKIGRTAMGSLDAADYVRARRRGQDHLKAMVTPPPSPHHTLNISPTTSSHPSQPGSPDLAVRDHLPGGNGGSAPTIGRLIAETLPSILLSLGGLVLAGSLLDHLQSWPAFERAPQLFVLVPTLLGLKGNLEMNLASRLSTSANLGDLDRPRTRWQLVIGNLALLQIQSSCVGGFAAVWSLLLGGAVRGRWTGAAETAMVCGASILTASVASLLLGLLMCCTVIVCRLIKVDPDNIATPVAASMGDLITLIILAGVSTGLHGVLDTPLPVATVVLTLSALPLWSTLVLPNPHVRDVLRTGWSPLLMAMSISSLGGLVLERFIDRFKGLALLIPVMNGVCGNLACVYASRISTNLHRGGKAGVGVMTRRGEKWDPAPAALFVINAPVQLLFITVVGLLGLGATTISLAFLGIYISASVGLVTLLLFITLRLSHFLWSRGLDPDDYIFSLITALGDVLGTFLIVLGFHLLVYGLGETGRLVEKTP